MNKEAGCHNSRKTGLSPSSAERIKSELNSAISQIENSGNAGMVRNAVAYLLTSYARHRIGPSVPLTRYICSKLQASEGVIEALNQRSLSFDPDNCGYLIDYILQSYLEGQPAFAEHVHDKANSRKALGAFYTPYEIASYICSKTIKDFSAGKRILDPACGTGVFLSAAGHQLLSQGVPPVEVFVSLYGWDKNNISIQISIILLSLELGATEEQILSGALDKNFTCKDTLLDDLDGMDLFSPERAHSDFSFDYVVANPPYDRLKPDGLSEKTRVDILGYADKIKRSGAYPLSTTGSLELYRLFMERIYKISANSNCRVGLIVPKSFAGDKNAQPLRAKLVNSKVLEEVTFIPEKARAFAGVSQAFAILVWDSRQETNEVKISTCGSLSQLHGAAPASTSVYKIISAFPGELNLIDLSGEGYDFLGHLNAMQAVRDVDWIKNKRGEVDLTFYKNILGRGEERLLRGRGTGEYKISAFDAIDYTALLSRLKSSDKLNDLMAPRLACQQIANMDSAKRLKFAYVDAGTALGNSLNYLVCKSGDEDLLFGLLGAMNSILMDWRFRIASTNNHVNNYEIDNLPIPDDLKGLKSLGAIVKASLHNIDEIYVRRKIENHVIRLYGSERYIDFLAHAHPMGHLLCDTAGDENAKAA